MSSTVETSFWSRNRWLLPVILAIIILAVIAGVIFARNYKSASKASPTATPTPASTPVTATPGAAGAVTQVVTATPGAGGSTPVPGGTPPPTVPGVVTGMITHKAVDVQRIQSGATAKNPTYTPYLDPTTAVQTDLPHYGFTSGSIQILSPGPSPTATPYVDSSNRPVIKFTVSYQGRKYAVFVAQVAKHGPGGIWLVITINPM